MDLKYIIDKLVEQGMKHQEIADAVPCSVSTIRQIKYGHRGSHPTYAVAAGLMALAKKRKVK